MAKTVNSGFSTEEQVSTTDITTLDYNSFNIKQVELQNYRNTLPHGLFVNGQRLQKFTLKDYDPEQDLKLATLYSNQKSDIKQVFGNFLPTIIETIGGRTLKEIAPEINSTPQQIIERLSLGDALTIILNARLQNVGELIEMEDQCPNCRTKNKDEPSQGRPYHSISEVMIGTIPVITDKLVVKIQLEQPFQVGEDLCDVVHMRPIKLYEMQKIQKSSQSARGKIDITLLQNQICGIPQATALQNITGQIFDDDLYRQIKSLKDRGTLLKVSEKLQEIGPNMNLPMSCYNCQYEWDSALPWGNLRNFLFDQVSVSEELV